jgi:hypothetical protein
VVEVKSEVFEEITFVRVITITEDNFTKEERPVVF